MMFGLDSFNLINEFERASNEPNAKQLASSSARLQPYLLHCIATQRSPLRHNTEFVSRLTPRARPPSCHDTNDCIVTHPTIQAARALPHALARCRPCCGPSWPYHGMPLLDRSAVSCLLARPGHACHDTTRCIVTQSWKGAVAHPASSAQFFPFFSAFFFLFVPATARPQKKIHTYIYIYMSSVEQNKFIKFFFIYIFPVLHTVKPQKKNIYPQHIYLV